MIYSTSKRQSTSDGQPSTQKSDFVADSLTPAEAPDPTLELDFRPLSCKTGRCVVAVKCGGDPIATHTIPSIYCEDQREKLAMRLTELGVVDALTELESAASCIYREAY